MGLTGYSQHRVTGNAQERLMSITDRIASLEPDTFMGDSWQDGYRCAIEDVLKLMANDAVTQRVDYCAEYVHDVDPTPNKDHRQ